MLKLDGACRADCKSRSRVVAGICTVSKARIARRWKIAERIGSEAVSALLFMLLVQHNDVVNATYIEKEAPGLGSGYLVPPCRRVSQVSGMSQLPSVGWFQEANDFS